MGNKKVELRNGGGAMTTSPPAVKRLNYGFFWKNRNNPQRADVGIGPYGQVFRQTQKIQHP